MNKLSITDCIQDSILQKSPTRWAYSLPGWLKIALEL